MRAIAPIMKLNDIRFHINLKNIGNLGFPKNIYTYNYYGMAG
jgi:hypothetical protein